MGCEWEGENAFFDSELASPSTVERLHNPRDYRHPLLEWSSLTSRSTILADADSNSGVRPSSAVRNMAEFGTSVTSSHSTLKANRDSTENFPRFP